MPASEFLGWLAFFKVRNERQTDTEPPQEFDSALEQAAALRSMWGRG